MENVFRYVARRTWAQRGLGVVALLGLTEPLSAQLVPLSTGPAVSGTAPPLAAEAAAADSRRIRPAADCAQRPDWRHRKLEAGEITGTLREAKAYFDREGLSVGSGVGVSTSANASAVYSEIASDFLRIGGPLGYARIGLGAMLVQSKQTGDSGGTARRVTTPVNDGTGIDRFRLAGGNAVLFVALPILHYESRSGGCSNSRFDILLLPRAAADVPKADGATTVSTGMLDMAAEAQWVVVTVSRLFRIFGTSRAGYVRGTASQYQALGLENRTSGFWYARWELGLDLSGRFRVSATRLAGGPAALIRSPIAAQVQLIP